MEEPAGAALQDEGLHREAPLRHLSGEAPLRHLSGEAPLRHLSGEAPLRHLSGEVPLRHLSGEAPLRHLSGEVPLRHLSGEAPHEAPLRERMRHLQLQDECARGSFSDADSSDDEQRRLVHEWKQEQDLSGGGSPDRRPEGLDMLEEGGSNPALPLKKRLPPQEGGPMPWAANQLPPEALTAYYRCTLQLNPALMPQVKPQHAPLRPQPIRPLGAAAEDAPAYPHALRAPGPSIGEELPGRNLLYAFSYLLQGGNYPSVPPYVSLSRRHMAANFNQPPMPQM